MSKTSVKTTVEWNTINWKQLERRVYKIQKRIDQALAGIHDKNHTTKDPYEVKVSCTVLETSRSGD